MGTPVAVFNHARIRWTPKSQTLRHRGGAAKEAIIRENPVHLDYLFYMANSQWIKPFVEAGFQGKLNDEQRNEKAYKVLMGLGLFRDVEGTLEFANPLYEEYWRKMNSPVVLFTNDK